MPPTTNPVAPAEGPLPFRMRPDLVVREHTYLGQTSFVVKDPLALSYYRFNAEEFSLLRMLDGRSSLAELGSRFRRAFPGKKLSQDELQRFVGSLYQANLVLAGVPGQGEHFLARQNQTTVRKRLGRFGNLLAIRFRGLDPQTPIEWLHRRVGFVFSGAALVLAILLSAAALLLVIVRFDVFQSRLPELHQFFGPSNVLWLALVLCLTKVAHELGHALVCRRFGARCHELGVLLLLFTPCLYCNVSDASLLRSKWQRAAVGAAGMYVELVLASLATFLWWFSEPGLLHHLALNVMFVCSASTLLFNANPLLRYDGYYILSDLVEIPNLRQRSGQVVRRALAQWCLGLSLPADPFLPARRRAFLAAYGLAAAIYRWLITLSILWFLHVVLRPYRLQILGQMLAFVTIAGLVVLPLLQVVRFLWVPEKMNRMSKLRLAITLLVLLVVGAGTVFLPLPCRVHCPLEVRQAEADGVYAEVAGTLAEVYVRPGQDVAKGEALARLADFDADLAVAELDGQLARLRSQHATLVQQRLRTPAVSAQIPPIEEAISAVEKQLQQKQADRARLTLRAPRSGVVLPAAETFATPADHASASWSGTLLDDQNLGCYVQASSPLCLVGDRREMEAVLVIDQVDVELVRPGDRVEIMLDELQGAVLHGTIEEIASREMLAASRRLSSKSGGDLATRTDAAGLERPQSTSYAARVRLDDEQGLLCDGLRGRAKVSTRRRTVAWQAGRYLGQTFRFK
ncbi:MAG: efflux RND transporter periplasmic adaptor subunit [Planctomycetia bacterium]|nr:efflux RND transporter periplasmic adaptor subunit [Planctomycetia bacterium]